MTESNCLSIVGAGLTSLRQVSELSRRQQYTTLCLHGNDITELQGLEYLTGLQELNLSSNSICSWAGFSSLAALTSLNIASNRLSTFDGMSALVCLERLNVSHNFISGFDGLAAQAGSKLTYLDCRNNRLSSVHSLTVLAGLPSLQELVLSGGSPGNACCHWPSLRAAIAAAFPKLGILDGLSLHTERQSSQARQLANILPQQLAAMQLQAFTPADPGLQPLQPSVLTSQQWQPLSTHSSLLQPHPPPSPLLAYNRDATGSIGLVDPQDLRDGCSGDALQQPQVCTTDQGTSPSQPSLLNASCQTPALSRKQRHKGCAARPAVSSKAVQVQVEAIHHSDSGIQTDLSTHGHDALQQQIQKLHAQLAAAEGDAAEQLEAAAQAKHKAMLALRSMATTAEAQVLLAVHMMSHTGLTCMCSILSACCPSSWMTLCAHSAFQHAVDVCRSQTSSARPAVPSSICSSSSRSAMRSWASADSRSAPF